MKRFLAISLALLLLTGCISTASAVVESDLIKNLGDFSQYGDGNMDKYDPAIDVSIGIGIDLAKFFPEGESYEDNVWSRAFRDELGINLKLAFATPDLSDKVNTMIASGDIPDMLLVNGTQLAMLANSGLIRDDVYEAYDQNAGTQLRTLIEGVGGEASFAKTTFNGKMVAFPMVNTSAGENTPVLYLRTDWMKKLGLSDPQNYADLRAILEAFTKQDPDGNGVDDTFGITFTKDIWSSAFQLDGFMNMFGSYPKSNFWVDDPSDASKIAYGAFQPETKAALTELNALYNEGILDKEFAINDYAAATQRIASGKVGATISAVWSPMDYLYTSVDNDPNADWHAIPIPGQNSPTTKVTANYPVGTYIVFSKNFEHPEALIRMCNLEFKKCFGPDSTLDTYQTYIESAAGGDGRKYSAFENYPWTGLMPAIKNEVAADLIKQGVAPADMPMYARPFGEYCAAYDAGDKSMWGWYRFFGPEGGHLITGRYIRENLYYLNRYNGPMVGTMADNMPLITQLVDEMIVKMIMGDVPIDQFDDYKAQADSIGLNTITDEANAWNASFKEQK